MNRPLTSRAAPISDDHDFRARPDSPQSSSSGARHQRPRGSDAEDQEDQEEKEDRDWLSGINKSRVLVFRACALFNYPDGTQIEDTARKFQEDEPGASSSSDCSHANCDLTSHRGSTALDQEAEHHENQNPNSSDAKTSERAVLRSWRPSVPSSPSKISPKSVVRSAIYNESRLVRVPSIERMPARKLNMTYKAMQAEMKLIAKMLNAHGFKEVIPTHSDKYNLLWTGIHLKPDVLRAMTPYQRVNHFPRSYELTRKDRLYKNIQQLQYVRGPRHCDFIPLTYVLPGDQGELNSAHNRNRGPWIVKPVASSRGRGIYLVDTVDKIPTDEQVVVAKYIADPLLINGHKCDLRLYVLVTSMDPLLVYLYEEGLVRLATVKYDSNPNNLWNPCIHLCNYSINKHHSDYVKSDDAGAEDTGHKRTLSALLRQLKAEGRDTGSLMSSVEDLVVKSLLACAHGMVAACRMFQPHPGNCFELFGFDILIDSSLKPWLLEVNLSPSLGVDSPLDLRVKASLVADLLTLVGIPAEDMNQRKQDKQKQQKTRMKMSSCRRVHSAETLQARSAKTGVPDPLQSLGLEEQRVIRWARAQYERRGGFVRIFPTPDTMHKYGQYLDPVTGVPSRDLTVTGSDYIRSTTAKNYNVLLHRHLFLDVRSQQLPAQSPERLSRYERTLEPEGLSSSFDLDMIYDRKEILWLDKENMENDRSEERGHLLQSLQNGSRLSKSEIRRAFGHYLTYVLRRITTCSSDEHNSDLVLKFLQKASVNLRTPYLIKMPAGDLPSKDRSAVIAKQLADFLYQYNRETESLCYESNNVSSINEEAFDMFLVTASEAELEEMLMQQTRIYEDDISWSSSCSNSRNQRRSQGQRHVQTGLLRLLRALPFLRACRAENSKITNEIIIADGNTNRIMIQSPQIAK